MDIHVYGNIFSKNTLIKTLKNILINLAIIEILIYVDTNTCDICNTNRCWRKFLDLIEVMQSVKMFLVISVLNFFFENFPPYIFFAQVIRHTYAIKLTNSIVFPWLNGLKLCSTFLMRKFYWKHFMGLSKVFIITLCVNYRDLWISKKISLK